MSSLRFCPRDHNKETSVAEYYPEEICERCEFYNSKAHIACGYYTKRIKEQHQLQQQKRKEQFLKELDELKLRIKQKDVMIQGARQDGQLGKAVLLLGQKKELEQMLIKKEVAKEKYFD